MTRGSDPETAIFGVRPQNVSDTEGARIARYGTKGSEMFAPRAFRFSDVSQAFAWLRRNSARDVNATITPSIQNCDRTASRCVL